MAVTPAIGAVELVTDEVLLVVILVVNPPPARTAWRRTMSVTTGIRSCWRSLAQHDPLTVNAQFCDVGSQYRPAIFVHNEMQRRLAERIQSARWPSSSRKVIRPGSYTTSTASA